MFMAAAPEGPSVLDFEAEEAAILQATARLPIHLVVEESGAARFLGERLDLDGPFEALHLSCHGDIHPQRGHVLVLEDEVGDVALADAGEIARLLGDPGRTPLVFLSACRTAEQAGSNEEGARSSEPFVREMTRAGVANVLGWDGSVYDADASAFAQALYRELASRERVSYAAAVARQALRRAGVDDPSRGRHWHLARLYLGPKGGGALAARGQPKRKLAGAAHADQFLDEVREEVPVAKHEEFVGRRRQAQAVLRAFRNGATSVLIYGMGSLGKSSLGARIASRMTGHKTVVVFRKYDALTVLDRVVDALPAKERAAVRETWRDAVRSDAAALREALEALLEAPLDAQPILLIIDDLEQILAAPTPSDKRTPVQTRYCAMLVAILSAFAKAQTDSRLLLTSRYLFSLPDGRGGDLADGLARVPLQPMEDGNRVKQLRAAARAANIVEPAALDGELVLRALAAASGNPGLQAALMKPILTGEPETAGKAIAAIEHYQQTGTPPEAIRGLIEAGVAKDESNAIVAFFKRMAFDTYRAALTAAQAQMLRAAGVFSTGLPIPRPALEAAGTAAGVEDPTAALDRLLGLGLVDDWGPLNATPHAAANPLARPLSVPLDEPTQSRLAAAALPDLGQAWRHQDGSFQWDLRAVELARLALVAPEPDPGMLSDAAEAGGRYLFQREHEARRAHDSVLQPALAKLKTLGEMPTQSLLLIACDCAERLGDTPAVDKALQMMESVSGEGADHAGALLYLARRHQQLGAIEAARKAFAAAAAGFLDVGQEREWAIARSGVADILQARGELDEALSLHEQRLPIAQKMGDIDNLAHTRFSLARIRLQRGDHQSGGIQQIYEDLAESFGINLKLGRPDGISVVGVLLAQVLTMGGQKDQALQILEHVESAYNKLGDAKGLAHISQLREMVNDA